MEQKQLEDSVDVGKMWEIAGKNKRQLSMIVAGGVLMSLLLAFILPKSYESTTLVEVRNTAGTNSALSSMLNSACLLYTSPSPRDRG